MIDLAQILISHGHPPESVDGYPICKMEAFSESIVHLDLIEDRRFVVNAHVATQGDSKSVKDYLKSLTKAQKDKKIHEDDADDLLSAFKGGFKGID